MLLQKLTRISLSEKHEKIREELEQLQDQSRPEISTLPPEINRILDCIHANLFEPCLNVNVIKSRCQFRNNNVSTKFRSVVGLGIREYIESARLQAAQRLLRIHDLEVYLIAQAVGYENQETFCRAFHRYFGQTPSAQREKKHQEEASREGVNQLRAETSYHPSFPALKRRESN